MVNTRLVLADIAHPFFHLSFLLVLPFFLLLCSLSRTHVHLHFPTATSAAQDVASFWLVSFNLVAPPDPLLSSFTAPLLNLVQPDQRSFSGQIGTTSTFQTPCASLQLAEDFRRTPLQHHLTQPATHPCSQAFLSKHWPHVCIHISSAAPLLTPRLCCESIRPFRFSGHHPTILSTVATWQH